MREFSSIKFFPHKLKFQNELKNKIIPILNKYIRLDNLSLKNQYFNNFKECQQIINLIEYTIKDIDCRLINLNSSNVKEFFLSLEYELDYIDIINQAPEFTSGIFLIPKGKNIPLHNHPDMLVISKVIWGKMLIKNYDKKGNIGEDGSFPVIERETSNLNINDLSILTPDKNNIHEVIALEDSAFFDIILPAYDHDTGRECDYYELIKYSKNNENDTFLKKI